MWWGDDLTIAEAAQLAELETTIARGLRTFYEVGQALTVIRDERLYRAGYETFERYCQERWSIVRQRAYQLIDAATIMSNVYSRRQTPTHKAQLRPLAGLAPTDQRAIWDLAAATAPDGIITAKHVKATADAYVGRTPKPAPPPPPPRGHDPPMDAWSWDDGRLSVLGLEPRLPQPPPHRPETTVVTVEVRLLGHTELELEAAIEHLHATSDAVGFHTVKAGRDGQWLAYGDMVLVVPAPAVAPMPAAEPAPAMGPRIRDLARALAACPRMRGGAIQIRMPFPRTLAQAVDAIGEAFAWHGYDEEAEIGRAELIDLCQTPVGQWPVPPAAHEDIPLNTVLLDDAQCPTPALTRLATCANSASATPRAGGGCMEHQLSVTTQLAPTWCSADGEYADTQARWCRAGLVMRVEWGVRHLCTAILGAWVLSGPTRSAAESPQSARAAAPGALRAGHAADGSADPGAATGCGGGDSRHTRSDSVRGETWPDYTGFPPPG